MAAGESWNAFGGRRSPPTRAVPGDHRPTGRRADHRNTGCRDTGAASTAALPAAAAPTAGRRPALVAPPTAGVAPVAPDAAAPPADLGASGHPVTPRRSARAGAAAPPVVAAHPDQGGLLPRPQRDRASPPVRATPWAGMAGPSADLGTTRRAGRIGGRGVAGGSGIRQRVAGASLSRTVPAVGPVDASTADPLAARALVEEFQAGVRRAERRHRRERRPRLSRGCPAPA